MSTIRAKFRVTNIGKSHNGKDPSGREHIQTNVTLAPVMPDWDPETKQYRESENKRFWDASPNGQIQIGMSPNASAADSFVLGQEYYVDFTPAT